MKPSGHYKIRYQRPVGRGHGRMRELPPLRAGDDPLENLLARVASSEHRVRRIVDSLRDEILASEDEPVLRVRQVFSSPREIYRLEIERPELGYQRTTLLDRDALETLLEADEVRDAFALALSA